MTGMGGAIKILRLFVVMLFTLCCTDLLSLMDVDETLSSLQKISALQVRQSFVNLTEPTSATFSSYTLLLVSERVFRVSVLG